MFQFPAAPVLNQTFTPVGGGTYLWNGTGWVLQGNLAALPPGILMPFAGAAAPSGFLLCDGSSQLTANFPALFAVIGYAYGGAGANFSMPDLRGRVIAGVDNMGGTAANRLTAGGSGITGTTLGAGGGAETVALTAAQHAVHAHGVNDSGHIHALDDGGVAYTTSGNYTVLPTAAGIPLGQGNVALHTTGVSVQNQGSGTAHTNTQPTLVLNYIIKT